MKASPKGSKRKHKADTTHTSSIIEEKPGEHFMNGASLLLQRSRSPTRYNTTHKPSDIVHKQYFFSEETEKGSYCVRSEALSPTNKQHVLLVNVHKFPEWRKAKRTLQDINEEELGVNRIIDRPYGRTKVSAPTNSVADVQDEITSIGNGTINLNIPISAEEKYPVLQNYDLVKRFLEVPLNNNQKGRIRQILKDIFKGTSVTALPDIINNRIQTILKSSENLTDTDLRKIRILYNMLKKATDGLTFSSDDGARHGDSPNSGKHRKHEVGDASAARARDADKKVFGTKEKKKKRYIVFVGNLPIDITKEQLIDHFRELKVFIKDIRIPAKKGKNSAIAYLELENEPMYELALTKHHSMLGNKRIKVMYSVQKSDVISLAKAKSKTAKLEAMRKKGQLLGSIPASKTRSARRKKAKAAQAQSEVAGKKHRSFVV